MNPLELVYCPETLALAVLASLGTELLKRLLDLFAGFGEESGGARSAMRLGADLRRQRIGLSQGLLPLVPLALGVALAFVLPYRPEVLEAAVGAPGAPSANLLYAGWGLLAGALGDYLYGRLREPWRAARNSRVG